MINGSDHSSPFLSYAPISVLILVARRGPDLHRDRPTHRHAAMPAHVQITRSLTPPWIRPRGTPRHVRPYRAAGRVGGPPRTRVGAAAGRGPARHDHTTLCRSGDLRAGQELRLAGHPRLADRPWHPPGDRPHQDGSGAPGRAQAADLRARDVDFRRGRRDAGCEAVALPHPRVRARVAVDQVRPAAPADPTRQRPVEGARPGPHRRRAVLRPTQERARPHPATSPHPGSGQPARRPHHLGRARHRPARYRAGGPGGLVWPPERSGGLTPVGSLHGVGRACETNSPMLGLVGSHAQDYRALVKWLRSQGWRVDEERAGIQWRTALVQVSIRGRSTGLPAIRGIGGNAGQSSRESAKEGNRWNICSKSR